VRLALAGGALRADRRGTVAVRVRCTSDAPPCRVAVALRAAGRRARASATVQGARTVRLRPSRRLLARLAAARALRATLVATARDAAGRRASDRVRVQVRAVRRR
jgi:hypothetical protein